MVSVVSEAVRPQGSAQGVALGGLSAAVAPSIDKFDFRMVAPQAPEVGNWLELVSSDGRTESFGRLVEGNYLVPSGAVVKLKAFNGVLSVKANPSRVRHWHALDGVRTGPEALAVMSEAVTGVCADLPELHEGEAVRFYRRGARGAEPSVLSTGVNLTRVDVCMTYSCGSEANAREFLRLMGLRRFAAKPAQTFRDGLTALWPGSERSVQYYAKWDGPFFRERKASDAERREALRDFLRSVGAVRHEVTLRGPWLDRYGLRSPSSWTADVVSDQLARSAPHLQAPARVFDADSVFAACLAAGFSRRESFQLRRVFTVWRSGENVREFFSERSYFRNKARLLRVGCDISAKPEGEAVAPFEVPVSPLVLPAEFRFLQEVA